MTCQESFIVILHSQPSLWYFLLFLLSFAQILHPITMRKICFLFIIYALLSSSCSRSLYCLPYKFLCLDNSRCACLLQFASSDEFFFLLKAYRRQQTTMWLDFSAHFLMLMEFLTCSYHQGICVEISCGIIFSLLPIFLIYLI